MRATTQRVKRRRAITSSSGSCYFASTMQRSTRIWLIVSVLGLASLGLWACGEEAAAPTTPGPTVVEVVPPPVPVEPRPSWDEPNFELVGTASGPFTAGTAGAFELRLTPRGAYHVNREYPWTVSVTAPEGVAVPTPTIESAGATEMTDTVARFTVPFTASAPGTHRMVAAVDFGICTEEGCQFEVRNVAVDVTVN